MKNSNSQPVFSKTRYKKILKNNSKTGKNVVHFQGVWETEFSGELTLDSWSAAWKTYRMRFLGQKMLIKKSFKIFLVCYLIGQFWGKVCWLGRRGGWFEKKFFGKRWSRQIKKECFDFGLRNEPFPLTDYNTIRAWQCFWKKKLCFSISHSKNLVNKVVMKLHNYKVNHGKQKLTLPIRALVQAYMYVERFLFSREIKIQMCLLTILSTTDRKQILFSFYSKSIQLRLKRKIIFGTNSGLN